MENVCERDAAGKLCRQDVTTVPSDSCCLLRMVLSRAWCLRKKLLKGTDTERTPEKIIP